MNKLREEINKRGDRYYIVLRRVEVDEKGRKAYYFDSVRPATNSDLIRYSIGKHEP